MWRRLSQICVPVVLMELCLVLLVQTMPRFDAGPQVNGGWGESIRIRRLYTARKHGQESYYLRIHYDGRVDGERHHSYLSLLEIRAVDVGEVSIKGYYTSLYLCMGSEGTLYGMSTFSHKECSFKEEILPDGYNMYKSQNGIAVSLSKEKQRLQSKGKGYPPLSHFLPVIHYTPLDLQRSQEDEDDDDQNNAPDVHSMDPLGLINQQSLH